MDWLRINAYDYLGYACSGALLTFFVVLPYLVDGRLSEGFPNLQVGILLIPVVYVAGFFVSELARHAVPSECVHGRLPSAAELDRPERHTDYVECVKERFGAVLGDDQLRNQTFLRVRDEVVVNPVFGSRCEKLQGYQAMWRGAWGAGALGGAYLLGLGAPMAWFALPWWVMVLGVMGFTSIWAVGKLQRDRRSSWMTLAVFVAAPALATMAGCWSAPALTEHARHAGGLADLGLILIFVPVARAAHDRFAGEFVRAVMRSFAAIHRTPTDRVGAP